MENVNQEEIDNKLKKFDEMAEEIKSEIITTLQELEPTQIIGVGKTTNDGLMLTIRLKDRGDYKLTLEKQDYNYNIKDRDYKDGKVRHMKC